MKGSTRLLMKFDFRSRFVSFLTAFRSFVVDYLLGSRLYAVPCLHQLRSLSLGGPRKRDQGREGKRERESRLETRRSVLEQVERPASSLLKPQLGSRGEKFNPIESFWIETVVGRRGR